MAKNIKVLVNTGNEETNKTFDVASGSGKAGKPTTIKAVKGARYHLEDPAAKNVGPENIRSKRVGKNLHVMLDGSKDADLIIEGYYDDAMLTENNRGLYGRAEDGKLYEYIPEDPTASGMPINLAEGGKPVSQVLGGGQVGEDFALSGVLLAAAGGGFSALTAGAAAVGAAALAGGGGGGGGAAAVTDPAATALTSIKTAAENNTATSGNLAASVFTAAGITGVDANNLAAIQSALDSAAVNGAAADTKAEVQAIVDAYNAIKDNADTAATTNATQAQYAAVGVTGIDNAAKTNLLGDVVDTKAFADVDTVPELQALANAAAAVITGAAAGTQPTKAQLEALGITGVTDANLSAIQAAIAATADDGTGVDTLSELQAVANVGATNAANAAAALSAISAAAQANNATDANVAASVFATAGVTGVDSTNVAAIQSALNSSAVIGTSADTLAEVQAIVDAYNAVKANADGTANNNATNPTQAQYAAIGVTGVDSNVKASLLGDVVDSKPFTAVDTVPELQALADAAAAVMTGAAGGTAPTKAQLEALGITGVTDANLAEVQATIARTADDGIGVDTLAELQAVVTIGADAAAAAAAAAVAAALAAISAAAQANDASNTNVAAGVFATAGVTGVDSTNVAAIQSALNSAAVNGLATDTLVEVQNIVNAYNAIRENADGTAANYANNPTQAQYALIGVTGVNSAEKESLLGDVVDAKPFSAVDSVPELQALADAAAAVIASTTGGTAPTQAQLTALGITGVTPANLAAVQAAIAANGNGAAGVDTLTELQTVVTNAAAAAAALDAIKTAAEANTATSSNLAASVFATAGVTGVTADNLAAIQSALDSAAVNGIAADTTAEVQAIVDAYNAIKANADTASTTNATQAQYAAVGVTGIDNAAKTNLLGDVVDTKAFADVDTVPELQALADAAAAVIASTTGGTAPTQAQLTALGITGVTPANLAAVQAAIAANGSGAAGVDTLTELQTVVTNAAAAAALDAIKTAAENNSAGTSPSVADFATAGITGVDSTNFAAINSALNSAAVNGAAADTKPEVQAIVDAYNAIKANADTASTTNATQAQYAAVGVTGIDNAAKTNLLGDVVDTKAFADVDTVPELQALANAAAAVITGATGGTAPTQTQLEALGITGVTPANLAAVQAAIAATGNGGTGVDTLTELQTVVTNAANAAAAITAALDTIKAAAEANTATSSNLAASVFATAGVTGVTANNLAAIQSALDSAAVNGIAADTTAEVQAVVDAYNAIKANADTASTTNATQAQYAAVGVTGIDNAAKTNLLGDVVDTKAFADVDTVPELQALANAAAAVITGAAAGTQPTKAQLEALGITGVTDANLSAIQAAIAATADDGTGVDTLSELQAVANTGATNAANAAAAAAALSTIAAAAQANDASNTNVPYTLFATAGVTGVDSTNVAAIQSALNDADVQSGQADTAAKVQAVVDAYNAILAEANDTANTAGNGTPDANPASNPTAAQYAAIGVNLGTAATDAATDVETLALLNAIVGGKQTADVDTVAEVQELATIANAIQLKAAGGTPNPALTVADLQKIGLDTTGVTADNLPTLLAAIAGKNDNGSETDTLEKLQALIGALDKVAPVGVNDTSSDTENALIQTGNVKTNDTSLDTTETFALVGSNVGSYGTLVLNSSGGYSYTYNTGIIHAITANVTDTFTYRVTDAAGNASTATLAVTVTPANTAPVNTVPSATQTLNEDATKVISGLSIADVDANGGSETVTLAVAHGTITVLAGTGVTLGTNGTGSVTLSGTVSAINTLLATANAVTYAPTANYNGNDTLTMTTNDGGNTGAGTALTDVDTVTINITPVNDAPTGGVTITGTPKVGQVLTASTTETGNVLADADGLGTLSYKWFADGTEISGATASTFTLTNAQQGKTITAQVSYTDGGNTAESKTSSATAAVAAAATAGDAVIDLGTSGNLIAPVQVEGKWYYFWDRSGNGDNTGGDSIGHDVLDTIFNLDINGNTRPNDVTETNDSYRYALINGVLVGLPTANGGLNIPQGISTSGVFQNGTSAAQVGATNNSSYDGMLALWDIVGGSATSTNINGTPTNWIYGNYATSTPSGTGKHIDVNLNGVVTDRTDAGFNYYVALEVVKTNAAPVLDATASPALADISAGASAPTNGNTTAGVLVSSLTGGITDGDAGAAKGIAITGVKAGATLYYSVDGGTTWLTAAGISDTNALLLAGDANTRIMYKSDGTAGSVSDAITFRAWDQTQHITEGVYANTTARGGKAEFSTASDTVAVTVTPPAAGDAVIDLGTSGKLIAPVQVEGKWYYYWDRSGDGTNANTGSLNGGTDITDHETLDSIFNLDINGNARPVGVTETDDTYRYALLNGVLVGLPTANGGQAFPQGISTSGTYQNGTSYTDAGATTNGTNSAYDGLLAIWDSRNGTDSAIQTIGVPTGWASTLWSATKSASGHVTIGMGGGVARDQAYGGFTNVALEVVKTNAAPVLDVTASPALADISAGASAPTNGNTTAGVLVSSLTGGITDGDAGAAKGIAITGVKAGATLYYSVDGGTTWLTAAGISDTNALLLAGDANTRIMYKSDGTAGSVSDAITFRAWDQTQHITEGVYADTTARGGKAEFSTATDTVAVKVTTSVVTLTDAINGEATVDRAGRSVSFAGDVNGDGFDDFIIGAEGADPSGLSSAGRSYVVFGGANNVMPLNLSELTVAGNSKGFVISGGSSGIASGYSVSAAGDLNGDGLADLLVGAKDASPSAVAGAGSTYVVYGKASTTEVSLASLGTGGYVIDGQSSTMNSGLAVSNAGDVNGDGIADLLVGAPNGGASQVGQTYVVFGQTGTTTVNLSQVANGVGGFVVNGEAANSQTGYTVSNAGDVNGDGLADVFVGAQSMNSSAGRSYVVFGKTSGTAVNLASLSTGGFAIDGVAANDISGVAVSHAGDVNGDGLADLIVGASLADPSGIANSGSAYVVFGKTGNTTVSLSALGTGGFAINGAAFNNQAGSGVSYAGDINADGLADLLVTAPLAADGGKAYVVYGKTGQTSINLSDVAAGSGGFVINNLTNNVSLGSTETSVSYAGDLNGDGYDDLLVASSRGAPVVNGTAQSEAGTTFVVYGGPQFITGNVATGTGSSADELVIGTSGADTLTGNGGVDRFSAGLGNDTIVLSASDVTNLSATTGTNRAYVDGGNGFDTLQVSASGVNLDLTAISNVSASAYDGSSRINDIERINLGADSTANTLTLAARDVNDMAGFNAIHTTTASADGRTWTNMSASTALSATTQFHQVVVDGTSADSLTLAAGTNGFWFNAGEVSNGTTNYYVYQNTATSSQVIVDKTVAVTNNQTNPAGQSVVDLGTSGKLIAPVQVEGKWYYYWDVNGDRTASTANLNGVVDYVSHDYLDTIFKYDINGNLNPNAGTNTNDIYRYATINGVQLALPTLNGNITGFTEGGNGQLGTTATIGGTSVPYDEMLAISDLYSGTTTSNYTSATPPSWYGSSYWTATIGTAATHTMMAMNTGGVSSNYTDAAQNFVALQIVAANTAPVLDATPVLGLTALSASPGVPTGAVGDLVSSLTAGITDADAGATKGIAITGVHTGATLYYSVNGGTTWTAASGITATNALLLAADTDTRVYYMANGVVGTATDAITFRAWDMTANITEGVYTDSTPQGGKAQFSTATDTVSITAIDPGIQQVKDTAMSLALLGGSQSATGFTPYENHAANYTVPAGVTFTLHKSDGTSLQTVNFTSAGGFATTFTALTGLTSGQQFYGTLDYAGVSYRLNTGVQFNGTSAPTAVAYGSPLVLDLNGDGVQTLALADGVSFDLLNTGSKQTVGWVEKHDGLLAIDLNGDGQINSGAELFGNHTQLANGTLAKDGWAALAAMDTNGDGKIDAQDTGFDQLRVWVDANSDGVTDAGELLTLAQAKVASINLHANTAQTMQNGNALDGFSSYTATDGVTHEMVDAWLQMASATVKTLHNGESLDLSNVSNLSLVSGIDMATDTAANTVKLTLADVLAAPLASGAASAASGSAASVHQLTLTGDANDTVQLDLSQWANTGNTVTEGAHTYAVYNASSSAAAQLLIDQHMMVTNHA